MSLSVYHHVTPFFQIICSFCLKLRILVGNRQTKKFFKKRKCVSVLNSFADPGCAKSSKSKRIMIVQRHADDEILSYFFKRIVIYIKFMFVLKRYEKLFISPIIGVCFNSHNSFLFGVFGAARVRKSIPKAQAYYFL